MYGPRWEFPHTVTRDGTAEELTVIMRPSDNQTEDAAAMASNLQHYPTTQFVLLRGGPTAVDETEFLEKSRTDKDVIQWVVEIRLADDQMHVLGVTGLDLYGFGRATSGILMSNTAWWNQGITRLTHRLRTWYAFEELGLHVVDSSYIDANVASGKALRGTGYIDQGRRFGYHYTAGNWYDEVLLSVYNPRSYPVLWPTGNIPGAVIAATPTVEAALDWARKVVAPR